MDYVERAAQVDTFDRAKLFEIYMDYVIRMAAMKHNFEVADIGSKGWSEPHKKFLGIGFYYLWKHYKIPSFDDFVSVECRYDERGIKRWYVMNDHLHVN